MIKERKMGKDAKKPEKTVKAGKRQEMSRISENVDCLIELHKLQGVLLGQMRKQVS